jgi:hypothetical protein
MDTTEILGVNNLTPPICEANSFIENSYTAVAYEYHHFPPF